MMNVEVSCSMFESVVHVEQGGKNAYPVPTAVTEHPCHHYILSMRAFFFFFFFAVCVFLSACFLSIYMDGNELTGEVNKAEKT